MSSNSHVVVVGSGVAGLTCALSLIERGHRVTIVTKSQTSDSATWYAQGGIASTMFPDDTTESHINDTMEAGAGLCDRSAVEVLVKEGADAVRRLISRGAQFDTLADGTYARTREGGHRNSRIIHAGGDATGEEIERSLVKAAADTNLAHLKVIDYHMVSQLLVQDNRCMGIVCIDSEGNTQEIHADHVVLATGGAGQLFAVTTNPVLATADGVALALQAGVLCADLEFMQFHPTALHVDNMPRPLLSEALRGEGSILRDENGIAFMENVHELKDLAPRDIVSREIARVLHEHHIDHVFLDATHLDDFAKRFPTIFASCEDAGIDPSKEFLPVSPAAHYFCGGIVTDIYGATSLSGLWAAGEVACNGVHGANRLASNSLLDGLVFGERVAQAIDTQRDSFTHTGVFSSFDSWNSQLKEAVNSHRLSSDEHVTIPSMETTLLRTELQNVMTRNVGVVRTHDLLEEALKTLSTIRGEAAAGNSSVKIDFVQLELSHLLRVGHSMITSAQARLESRGCHTRDEYPTQSREFLGRHITAGLDSSLTFVPLDSVKNA